MFNDWTNAIRGTLFVLLVFGIAATLSALREGSIAQRPLAFLGLRRGIPPDNGRDVWMESIGQRREDRKRRGTVARLLVIGVIIAQAAPMPPNISAVILLFLWLGAHYAFGFYDRLLLKLIDDDMDMTARSLLRLLLAPATVFLGSPRLLGPVGGIASFILGLYAWVTLLMAIHAPIAAFASVQRRLIPGLQSVQLAAYAVAVLVLARLPLAVARRLAARYATVPDGPIDVIYLRSFRDDGLKLSVRGITRGLVDRVTLNYRGRYEQLIVSSLQYNKLYRNVVTVGAPGERLPPTGAWRMYLNNDEWQDVIEMLMLTSRRIVVSLGTTPSVGWEISKIRELQALNKTLFLLPPVPREGRAERLALVKQQLALDPTKVGRDGPGAWILGFETTSNDGTRAVTSTTLDYASYLGAIFGDD